MNLAVFIDKLTSMSSIEELWGLHCDKMADFGFEKIFYGFNNYRLGRHWGRVRQRRNNTLQHKLL